MEVADDEKKVHAGHQTAAILAAANHELGFGDQSANQCVAMAPRICMPDWLTKKKHKTHKTARHKKKPHKEQA